MRAIGDVILEIEETFKATDVRHAFGGALALAYYAEPRGTVDIDVNVGVPYGSRSALLADLDSLGWQVDHSAVEEIPLPVRGFIRSVSRSSSICSSRSTPITMTFSTGQWQGHSYTQVTDTNSRSCPPKILSSSRSRLDDPRTGSISRQWSQQVRTSIRIT